MRDVQWALHNGAVLVGIAFPCKNAPKCWGEVLVDENHPDYHFFKKTPVASCNACFSKMLSDVVLPAPLTR